jgi:hypothetical protein
MSIEHFNIKCSGNGCEHTIAIHLRLFVDLVALSGMVRNFGWRLLDAEARDPQDPVKQVVALLCVECARKVLPTDSIEGIDKDEAERRSKMS